MDVHQRSEQTSAIIQQGMLFKLILDLEAAQVRRHRHEDIIARRGRRWKELQVGQRSAVWLFSAVHGES